MARYDTARLTNDLKIVVEFLITTLSVKQLSTLKRHLDDYSILQDVIYDEIQRKIIKGINNDY